MPQEIINSLENLIDLARNQNIVREKADVVWWRGQSDKSWKLLPGVYRKSTNPRYERNLLAIFRQGAQTRHSVCPPEDDAAGWLFLMQHHGLPTRLLDWTESPLVAAFFACRERLDSDGALWVLNPFKLNEDQIEELVITGVETPQALRLLQWAFLGDETNENKVVALISNENDIRMLTQLSAFTVHQPGKPLDEIAGKDRFLQKLIIPSACKRQILKDLDGLGIRLPNLFPDLDHLAEYISALPFPV